MPHAPPSISAAVLAVLWWLLLRHDMGTVWDGPTAIRLPARQRGPYKRSAEEDGLHSLGARFVWPCGRRAHRFVHCVATARRHCSIVLPTAQQGRCINHSAGWHLQRRRQCQPRTDRDGCADTRAPRARSRAYRLPAELGRRARLPLPPRRASGLRCERAHAAKVSGRRAGAGGEAARTRPAREPRRRAPPSRRHPGCQT